MLHTAKLIENPVNPMQPIAIKTYANKFACLPTALMILALHVPAVGLPFLTSENRKNFDSLQNPEHLKSVSRISRIGKYFVFYMSFSTV